MLVLAIESSCDETAVALLDDFTVIDHINISQKSHSKFGGVIPEAAARLHCSELPLITKEILYKNNKKISDVNLLCVTCEPGLKGCLMVGKTFAHSLSFAQSIPIQEVNHLHAHILTAKFSNKISLPYLSILISGGHCQIVLAEENKFTLLGETLDDAPGEAFDKVGKMLQIDYPSGPLIEKLAESGNCRKHSFAKPLYKNQKCDFSFSGLKTSVKRVVDKILENKKQFSLQEKQDVCASFQYCVAKCIEDRLENAIKKALKKVTFTKVVLCGGVASNKYIFDVIDEYCKKRGFDCHRPPKHLCTDNAIMVGWNGLYQYNKKN